MAGPSVSRESIRFGLFEFDPQSGELRKQGIRIRLQGQPVEILSMLLARPGELVTREELQKKLWPQDTFVDFDRSLNAAVKRLRAALGDSAETPRFIETLARRGYRFLAPVDAQPVVPVEAPVALPPGRRAFYPRRLSVQFVVVAVTIVALGITLFSRKTVDQAERIDSLLVLPLKNLSGDPEQDYFAEGMTDALNARLAGVSAL